MGTFFAVVGLFMNVVLGFCLMNGLSVRTWTPTPKIIWVVSSIGSFIFWIALAWQGLNK